MRRFRTILVGGGAAGCAVLIAANKAGLLPGIARDLCVIERGPAIGGGTIGRYQINSDSSVSTFLSAVRDNPVAALAALVDHPAALAVEGFGADGAVPLPVVGRFLDAVGQALHGEIVRAGGSVLTRSIVNSARRHGDGWQVALGDGRTVVADRLVLATGAQQPLAQLADAVVAGEPLVARCADRLIQSDELLAGGGLERVHERLEGRSMVRVAIVGGSTSALASANRLLRDPRALPFPRHGLSILHRSPLLTFYSSADEAGSDGYHGFNSDDICGLSGFVHRFGGLRFDARDLVRRQLGRTGSPDPRLHLHRIQAGRDDAALALLDEADLVIAALGYRPRALRLCEAGGQPIELASGLGRPLVDAACRVVRADGDVVEGVFAIGLAAGYRPSGELGGEASFKGQVNGLWLWQNGVGALIARAIAEPLVTRVAA